MIDFPVGTDGLIFSAPNGVVYKYSATYSSWLAQNPAPPLGGTGDFTAVSAATQGIDTVVRVCTPTNVINGNAGSWFNTANGRWTPPAGRYNLYGTQTFTSPGTATTTFYIYLYKNGAQIPGASNVTMQQVASSTTSLAVETNVDANGADYFELRVACSTGATLSNCTFGAFPLTGMQGPTGPPFGGGTGDFYATRNSDVSLVAGFTTMIPNTVVTGNSGIWYSTSTGRWTPPAGRYFIQTWTTVVSGGAGAIVDHALRKNGTVVDQNTFAVQTGLYGELICSGVYDANGSDYFDCASASTANAISKSVDFLAYPLTGMQGPAGPAGVTQTVFFETGALAFATTIIPADNTIPQQTEGDQYMSLAITPQSATSKLIIEVTAHLSSSVANNLIAALFQDSAANALAVATQYQSAAQGPVVLSFKHVMTAGTTNSTTFKLRAGGGSAGTTNFNGTGGAGLFGGTLASSIVIREVAP